MYFSVESAHVASVIYYRFNLFDTKFDIQTNRLYSKITGDCLVTF